MSTVLGPIEWAVSWIMVQFHTLFTSLGMDTDGGLTWALSIVGLVMVIRTLLIPLFVKQIRSQRGMQLLQPKLKELQKKHAGDRERQSQEMMKLYKETGTNPLASCLPILLQAPIFFALFRVLNDVAKNKGLGFLSDKPDLVQSAANATLFGAPISSTFLRPREFLAGTTPPVPIDGTAVHVVAAILIVLMSAAMFFTQRQLMTKNMPAAALEGPFAQQQKIMLYLFPAIFLVTGVNFPIGVLIYWLTTNVWSMCQQLVVIARMPAPNSPAERRLLERRAAKEGKGAPAAAVAIAEAPVVEAPRGQRQQPKRNAAKKKTGTAGPVTGGGSPAAGSGDAPAAGDAMPAAPPNFVKPVKPVLDKPVPEKSVSKTAGSNGGRSATPARGSQPSRKGKPGAGGGARPARSRGGSTAAPSGGTTGSRTPRPSGTPPKGRPDGAS